jgi:glycosyltransferase involved in cell wall biosynthesis
VLRVYHSAVVTAWRERDRQLRALGCDVTLVSPRRWNEGGRVVALDARDDRFVVPARTVGHHPYRFAYNPIPVIRALRREHFDVIDVHEEPASLAAFEVFVLARLFQPGVPVVFYGAQNIAKRFPPPFRWTERYVLRRAAGAHCCNSDAGEIFRQKGLGGHVRTIGLGVDIERFNGADASPTESPLRVGYFGRLERHKGVHVLIDAIAQLPDVALVLHGDGPARGDLERRVRELALTERVTFAGHVDHDLLPSRYRAVDIVAVPSLRTSRWVEQFGRVAVEAMACGVPVIASDDGALRDVVGGAGLLVRPGDVAAWRDAIGELGAHPARRSALAAAGRARAARYRWSAIADQQIELYRAVAA